MEKDIFPKNWKNRFSNIFEISPFVLRKTRINIPKNKGREKLMKKLISMIQIHRRMLIVPTCFWKGNDWILTSLLLVLRRTARALNAQGLIPKKVRFLTKLSLMIRKITFFATEQLNMRMVGHSKDFTQGVMGKVIP